MSQKQIVKVLGIAASPQKRAKSTSAIVCEKALLGAESFSNDNVEVQTDIIYLADLNIKPCSACVDPKGKHPGVYCGFKRCIHNDDMTNIVYDKLMDADGILISTPVHFGGVTAQLKALFDRTCWLKMRRFWGLRNKVGGAISVAHGRHGGQEITVIDCDQWMRIAGMLPVGFHATDKAEIEEFIKRYENDEYYSDFVHDLKPYLGAVAHYPGVWNAKKLGETNWMDRDWIGMEYARRLGFRVAQVASWVKPNLPSKEERDAEIAWYNELQFSNVRS